MKRGFILNTPPTLRKTALITGASAGIGRDYARYLAAEGFDLILTARRKARLEEVARELSGAFGTQVTVLTADLTDPAAPTKLAADIRKKGLQVDYLVNNAGYQVPGFFDRVRWDVQRDMMQIMMTAVAELCHIFGPEWPRAASGALSIFLPSPLLCRQRWRALPFGESLCFALEPEPCHRISDGRCACGCRVSGLYLERISRCCRQSGANEQAAGLHVAGRPQGCLGRA